MNLNKTLILSILFFVFNFTVSAQQKSVDSIIIQFKKINLSKPIDTIKFVNLLKRLDKTTLNDDNVITLNKVAEDLNIGDNIFWNYMIKSSIANSLNATDKGKAITFGKQTNQSLLSKKSEKDLNIRSYFLRNLRIPYRTSDKLDDGFNYYNSKLKEYKSKNDSVGMADCYYVLAGFYKSKGLIDQAIYNQKKSGSYISPNTKIMLDFSPASDNKINMQVNNNAIIGVYYYVNGNYKEALKYETIAFNTQKEKNGIEYAYASNMGTYIAMCKIKLGSNENLEPFLDEIIKNDKAVLQDHVALALNAKAMYKIKNGDYTEAEKILNQSTEIILKNNLSANSPAGIIDPDYYLALIRIKQNRLPEAIAFLKNDVERKKSLRYEVLRDYKLLSELNEKIGNIEEAYFYSKSFISLQENLLQDEKKYGSLSFETEQQISKNELSISKLQSENKISSITRNFIIGIAILLILLAALIYYRFKAKQKDNIILENTLKNLKATQSQLIQSEKMASLGELTAGIAHEIQNPLNFVNNFSEVSKELLDEMKEELDKGNTIDAKEIADDVIQNLEKINHHGKRADAIVKGMLQHSRSSSGKKEPTDLNALCDEYLRLSYHGLRAKDKSFNATMKTDFDENIGKIKLIPQDFGRVILNLLTNAFYAVTEKKNLGLDGFEPTVSISTKKENNKIIISVSDNGNGMPQEIIDKVFQPFFTTKPTGKGTGLGLSMSYDIVTKGHGGELKVESKEGEQTKFIITLPE